ncbi:hypothetical protein ACJMK2_003103 [Sinanodonta woodiana]|uniref:G-protein coupled receptors family 1 profile domain-containing protein n=1 Tax=Sinanodonta woodiana TaxID=1069815 RepID=A0ABD3Y0S2_SINWO
MFIPLKDLPGGKNWTLDELNERQVQLLIPVIIFISIAMVVGTVGNALVLYVNIFFIKLRNSTHRHFIIFLALADITFCMIGDPFVIGVLTHPYKFTNIIACKCFRAFTYFNAVVSVLVLFVIALDRYRRICRPYGNQFSIKSINAIFGFIVFISIILSMPSFIMYGKNTVQTGIAHITGISCFPEDIYINTMFPIAYNIFLYSVYIILTVLMCLFYISVWRQVRKHANSTKILDPSYTNEPYTSTSTAERTVIEMNLERTLPRTKRTILDDLTTVKDLERCANMESKHNIFDNRSINAKSINVSKTLFVVTVFFVLSFAPFLSLEVIIFLDKEIIESLDNISPVFYQLLWRSFAINFMVNPIIYGVMDRPFRLECRKLVFKCHI